MPAPTWPPTPEDAARLTMEEYGLEEADLGLEDPEELEAALLAQHLFADPKRFGSHSSQVGTPLSVVRRPLEAWLRMVSGRDLRLGVADPPATDGEGLYLPMAAPAPAEPALDRALYRVMGLCQLGLLEQGFLRSPTTLRRIYEDFVLRSCYHLLALRAVLAEYSRRFPGFAADVAAVTGSEKCATLRVAMSEVPRSALSPALVPLLEGWVPGLPAGAGDPQVREIARAVDAAEGPAALLVVLGQAQALRERCRAKGLGAPPIPAWAGLLRPEWLLAELEDDSGREAWRAGLNRPLAMLQAARAEREQRRSLLDAPGEAPQRGGLRARLKRRLLGAPERPAAPAQAPVEPTPPPLPERPSDDDGGLSLDEWDQDQGGYRLGHVQLRLEDAPGGALSNYQRLVDANAREIRAVRRRFAALRQEDRWVTGLPDGPEVDLDRAITALTDLAAGQQPKEDLYRRFVRHPHDLCALVLVDMSGSTQGHVLHMEQEALVLLAEGVSALGLPHAFYGFSGVSPGVGRLLRLKGFDERYDDGVKRRLGNLRAAGATRMGAYIRGGARLLARQPQPRRLLLMLSDGRPEDQDRYRGAYGVADSAMAVREASRLGVRCFCIGLDDDEHADTWLRPIFGPGRSLKLRRVEQLPARLPEVFRGLL